MEQETLKLSPKNIEEEKKIIGWYCLNHAGFDYTTAFATYQKPNFIKMFLMRTLLDFYWIKNENK